MGIVKAVSVFNREAFGQQLSEVVQGKLEGFAIGGLGRRISYYQRRSKENCISSYSLSVPRVK